jgi:hypothetical protein
LPTCPVSRTFVPAASPALFAVAGNQLAIVFSRATRVMAPPLRPTYKAEGKTISEALPSPAAVRKAEREISEFRKYQQMSRDFIEVNEKICRLRPVQDTLTLQEKETAEAVHREVAREVDQLLQVVFAGLRITGRLDLEAIETATRAAMHRAGAGALHHLLKESGPVPATVGLLYQPLQQICNARPPREGRDRAPDSTRRSVER